MLKKSSCCRINCRHPIKREPYLIKRVRVITRIFEFTHLYRRVMLLICIAIRSKQVLFMKEKNLWETRNLAVQEKRRHEVMIKSP